MGNDCAFKCCFLSFPERTILLVYHESSQSQTNKKEKRKRFSESTLLFTPTAPWYRNNNNMHSCYCPSYIILHLCTVIKRAIMPPSWKGRIGFYQSRVPLHLHVYKNRKKKSRGITGFYWMQFLRFNREVHLTADKWTVQSIYAIITGFRFFFLMIIAISATFVTCHMSINTADFLCQCIVHVLGIILFFCLFFKFLFGLCFFWRRCLISFPDRQVCVQSRRLCPQLWVDFCTLYGEKKLRRGGRRRKKKRNPGLFWWSCIRLHYYSIWCAICDSWMFLVYLCSLHPTREKTVE